MSLVVCKQCGAKISEEYNFCPYCKASIGGPPKLETHIGEEFCPSCNAKTSRTQKFCPICGHPLTINVEEVLNATLRIVRKAPFIVLPTIIFSILSTIFTVWFDTPLFESTSASPSVFIATLWSILPGHAVAIMFGILASPVVNGMYPYMVRDAYEGRTLDMLSALRKTMKRYPSIPRT